MDDIELVRQEWCKTIPDCLKPFEQQIAELRISATELLTVLRQSISGQEQVIRTLLRWNSYGSGAWWYPFFMPYEQTPHKMLQMILTQDMLNILEGVDLNSMELEGLARYFVALNRHQPQAITLSNSLKIKLFKHCSQSLKADAHTIHKRYYGEALRVLGSTLDFGTLRESQVNTDNAVDLTQAMTNFAFALLSELIKQQPKPIDNIFISPISIFLAVSLLLNGTVGETEEGIRRTLWVDELAPTSLNQANGVLRLMLENQHYSLSLLLANSVWVGHQLKINPDFLSTLQEFYNAEARNINFSDPESPAIVNRWVDRQTHGNIKAIVDRFDPLTTLVLINTIYFKARWEHQFEDETKPHVFTLPDGTTKMHPLMFQYRKHWSYLETETFQSIRLPYDHSYFEMIVFLPSRESSLAAFQASLSAQNWKQWLEQFSDRPGTIGLPRFKMSYESLLASILGRLGMAQAFDRTQADLSKIGEAPPPIWVNEVIHKTYIKVDENGTEAAAVTAIGVLAGSMWMPDPTAPFEMTVDRPFFFAIYDKRSKTILFMGTCSDPQE